MQIYSRCTNGYMFNFGQSVPLTSKCPECVPLSFHKQYTLVYHCALENLLYVRSDEARVLMAGNSMSNYGGSLLTLTFPGAGPALAKEHWYSNSGDLPGKTSRRSETDRPDM